MILFPLFATSIVDTCGNLLPVSTTPAVPVSLMPVAHLPLVYLTPAANLQLVSLVSLISDVHLHLRISQQIFGKILDDPNVIFGGLGEDDS